MRIGFTGTQEGMTRAQEDTLQVIFDTIAPGPHIFNHGDCIGSDAQAHIHALSRNCDVHLHPPDDPSKRAFCEGSTHVYDLKPYLVRNKWIVDCCAQGVLIATPAGFTEEQRSGTWSTIRYARQKGRRIIIIWPDGLCKTENA